MSNQLADDTMMAPQVERLVSSNDLPSKVELSKFVTERRINYASAVNRATSLSLRSIIKELLDLHKEGRLKEEKLVSALEVVISAYAESEIRARIDSALTSQVNDLYSNMTNLRMMTDEKRRRAR